MRKILLQCENCNGNGHMGHKLIPNDDGKTRRFVKGDTCEVCEGNGYIEYAVLSIEEAEAILEHCGLITTKSSGADMRERKEDGAKVD